MKHTAETRGSSMFTEISYDDVTKVMIVDMINHGRYSYNAIPMKVWERFKNAASHGSHYNEYIKGVYPYTRLR